MASLYYFSNGFLIKRLPPWPQMYTPLNLNSTALTCYVFSLTAQNSCMTLCHEFCCCIRDQEPWEASDGAVFMVRVLLTAVTFFQQLQVQNLHTHVIFTPCASYGDFVWWIALVASRFCQEAGCKWNKYSKDIIRVVCPAPIYNWLALCIQDQVQRILPLQVLDALLPVFSVVNCI